MKKKIIVGLVVLGMMVLGVGAGQYFSDSKVSVGNLLAAGTLTLDVTPLGEDDVASYQYENLQPGDTGGWDGISQGDDYLKSFTWVVKNTGTLDGVVTAALVEPEEGWGLGTRMRPQVRVNGVWKTESSGFHNLNPFSFDLAAGEEAEIRIAWSFQASGNEWQGQEVEFGVNFGIKQADR